MTTFKTTAMLPWHYSVWKQLCALLKQNQLPPALLIQGASNSGKRSFIQHFSKTLLCQQAKDSEKKWMQVSCNHCQSCVWFQNKTHPDYHALECATEKQNTKIPIATIRTLINTVHQKPVKDLTSKWYSKVVFIHSVESLQEAGINALLKTIEEPPTSVLFIFSTCSIKNVASTFRSRCRLYVLPKPSLQEGTKWIADQCTHHVPEMKSIQFSLELSDYVPTKALDYLTHKKIGIFQEIFQSFVRLQLGKMNPITLAQTWSHYPAEDLIKILLYILTNWIQYKFGSISRSLLDINKDTEYLALVERKSLLSLFEDLDTVQRYHSDSLKYSLNALLQLEVLIHHFYAQSV